MAIMEIVHQRRGLGPGYLQDTRDGSKYRLTAGAIAWPSTRPGALIVVGVSLSKDLELRTHKIRVLAAAEEASVTALAKKAFSLRDDYFTTEWYGNQRSPMMQMVIPMNDQLRMLGKPEFWPIEPHRSRDPKAFGFYVAASKDFLARGVLDLGTDNPVSARLLELPPEEVPHATVEDYPMITALGYVVTSLEAFRPWEHQAAQQPPENLFLSTDMTFR